MKIKTEIKPTLQCCFKYLVLQTNLVHEDRFTVNYHDFYYYIGAAIALSSTICNGFLNITISCCTQVKSVVLLWWAGIGAIFASFICEF